MTALLSHAPDSNCEVKTFGPRLDRVPLNGEEMCLRASRGYCCSLGEHFRGTAGWGAGYGVKRPQGLISCVALDLLRFVSLACEMGVRILAVL